MSINSAFLACNRNPQAASLLKNSAEKSSSSPSWIVFGANHYVCLYDPMDAEHRGIRQTLAGHRDQVVCTAWIQPELRAKGVDKSSNDQNDNLAFVSGSADGTARLWTSTAAGKFETECELLGHTATVQTICTLKNASADGADLIVTGSADASCRVWLRRGAQMECVQTIDFMKKYPMAMAVALLPQSDYLVLAVGGTDLKIHIYAANRADMQFKHKLALSGHTDWIRSLDFSQYTESEGNGYHRHSDTKDGDLLLVSASQDRYIRLWRFATWSDTKGNDSIFDSLPENLLSSLEESSSLKLSTKAHVFSVGRSYAVFLDAVLMGHDSWVYSVQWQPAQIQTRLDPNGNSKQCVHQPMRLLSASSDKTVIIWSPDAETGVWTSTLQVGDFSGHTFGVYGAMWSPDGDSIVCFDYHGSFQIWSEEVDQSSGAVYWRARLGITGHHSAVHDLSWDPTHNYLLTCSHDRTTRIFAPWKNTWHECARPQVHGYNLRCLAFTEPFKYACGSDGEKVVRLFDASQTFVQSIAQITGRKLSDMGNAAMLNQLPVGAAVPALGLSNKATDNRNPDEAAMRPEDLGERLYDSGAMAALDAFEQRHQASVSQILMRPPTEDHLQQYTLWPETDKLYGHGNEIFALATSHDFRYLASASACRAGGQPEDAAVRIWDLKGEPLRESQPPLLGHQLTVTAMQFSWSDEWLVSVSRDRSWHAYRRDAQQSSSYGNACAEPKGHARIIWGVSFTHDDRFFVTGSRDKLIKTWHLDESGQRWVKCAQPALHSHGFAAGVTSVAFVPVPVRPLNADVANDVYLLAVGLESGGIQLMCVPVDNPTAWTTYMEIDPAFVHISSVTRMAWRVVVGNSTGTLVDHKSISIFKEKYANRILVEDLARPTIQLQLATCSDDNSVRIFDVPCRL